MKISELVKALQDKSKGQDLEVVFMSEVWTADLSRKVYREADLQGIRKSKDTIVIKVAD